MKKIFSNVDVIIFPFILFIIVFLFGILFIENFVEYILYIGTTCILMDTLIVIASICKNRSLKKKLPLSSGLNLFDVIEIHVTLKCKKNRLKFLKGIIKTVLIAIKTEKNIMFDNTLIKKEHIEKYFKGAYEIHELNPMALVYVHFFRIFFRTKSGIKPYRYIINVKKLSKEQKMCLEELLAKLKKHEKCKIN